jgi:hypothetical protein
MRNILEVEQRMINSIPDGAGMKQALAESMEFIRSDIPYRAPEQVRDYWVGLANIVNRYIQKPYEQLSGWQKEVVDIFTDRQEQV